MLSPDLSLAPDTPAHSAEALRMFGKCRNKRTPGVSTLLLRQAELECLPAQGPEKSHCIAGAGKKNT